MKTISLNKEQLSGKNYAIDVISLNGNDFYAEMRTECSHSPEELVKILTKQYEFNDCEYKGLLSLKELEKLEIKNYIQYGEDEKFHVFSSLDTRFFVLKDNYPEGMNYSDIERCECQIIDLINDKKCADVDFINKLYALILPSFGMESDLFYYSEINDYISKIEE